MPRRHYRATFFEVLNTYSTERLLEMLVQGNNPAKLTSWLRSVPEPTEPRSARFVTAVQLRETQ